MLRALIWIVGTGFALATVLGVAAWRALRLPAPQRPAAHIFSLGDVPVVEPGRSRRARPRGPAAHLLPLVEGPVVEPGRSRRDHHPLAVRRGTIRRIEPTTPADD